MTVPSPEQKAVIEHPLAPLRVAAGAGTGKTTTIALRLAHFVAEDNVEPEAALGITFTNKAAEELADRLRQELPELAKDGRTVEVTTYHGFAYRLLQEFGALVGMERDAQVIGPGFARQLLHDALATGAYEHLDLTAVERRVQEAAVLASQLGENLAEPADLIALDEAPPVGAARRELATTIGRYQADKVRLRTVDYADLIRLSHRLVTEHPAIAARIRSRYAMVLLDEYQDTSPAQRELLRIVFGAGFPVTAVGDSDQTIYEWRGASLANFDAFPEHFPTSEGDPAPTLPLTLNRRSDQRIVDLANRVRAQVAGAEPAHPLRPLSTEPGDVRRGYFATSVAEALWLAGEARRLHDEEGLAWQEMAVLFRKNAQIPLVRDALDSEGIPVEVVSLGGLLSVPEVTDLHAWLRLIGDPEDTPALVRILLGSRYRLGLGDLAPLTAWTRAHAGDRREDAPGWPMLEAVDSLEHVADLSPEAHVRLAEFRRTYRSLLAIAQGVTLVDLCRRILDVAGAWADVDALSPAAALSARLNLYRFLDLAEGWSPLEGRPSLEAFLGYLEVLADENAADELDTARVGGEDAVSLLTVHRAKGLEWEAVFLPALSDLVFPTRAQEYDDPTRRAHRLPYALRLDAATLPSLEGSPKEVQQGLKDHHLAQEWRTAYVAVTRARHRLYLTGAAWYKAGAARPKAPSELWSLADGIATTFLEPADPGPSPDRLAIPLTGTGPDPLFGEEGWPGAIRSVATDPGWARERAGRNAAAYDARVDQFELMLEGLPEPIDDAAAAGPVRTSVTGLVTVAACPKRFYWSEIDPLPRRPGRQQRRGIELHRRIELHNRGAIPFDEVTDVAYDLIGEGDATPAADPPTSEAVPVAAAFTAFSTSRFSEIRPVLVEAPFDLNVAGGRLRGRVDAVYRHEDGAVEIVDFKSGRSSEDPARRVQLQAYAVAAMDGALELTPPDRLTVTFAYFGSGRAEEQRETVDDEWLDEARTTIGSLLGRAAGPEYPESPSPACRSCDFLRFCGPGKAFLADPD